MFIRYFSFWVSAKFSLLNQLVLGENMINMNILNLAKLFCVFSVLAVVESGTDREIKEDEVPSKVQQRNLIETGRELCGFLRDVVSTEARESEDAVQKDVDSMIQRAKDHLDLVEENFSMKLSCNNNDVRSRGFHEEVPKLREVADKGLIECQAMVADQTSVIANKIHEDALKLEQEGQEILNEFLECSKKGTWTMFSCYKKTMGAKMSPMKEYLMDTVKAHSRAHTDFLTARSNAATCIDQQLAAHRNNIEEMYKKYNIIL